MKLLFRHGIVKYQTDISNNPNFLHKTSDNYVTLYVSPDPTIFTVSHGGDDYLFEESTTIAKAWGPFTPGYDYWLYWDINIKTGERTFGTTIHAPVIAPRPPLTPAVDQHWYDKSQNVMKVWQGIVWIEVIRVFAGRMEGGAVLIQNTAGSQVGTNTTTYAGAVLFDNDSKPVRKTQTDGKGKFLTTESPFFKQYQTVSSIKFETAIAYYEAIEHIPAWSLVTFKEYNKIGLASYDLPYRPAIGIVQQDLHTGEVGILTTNGFVTNLDWNWTQPANTPLFCGPTGELLTTIPHAGIVHKVGYIVDSNTIFIEKSSPVHYFDAAHPTTTVPVTFDINTGKLIVDSNGTGGSSHNFGVIGYTHTQNTASAVWEISHNKHATNCTCTVFDSAGHMILPDDVHIVDSMFIRITFNVVQTGKAQFVFIL